MRPLSDALIPRDKCAVFNGRLTVARILNVHELATPPVSVVAGDYDKVTATATPSDPQAHRPAGIDLLLDTGEAQVPRFGATLQSVDLPERVLQVPLSITSRRYGTCAAGRNWMWWRLCILRLAENCLDHAALTPARM